MAKQPKTNAELAAAQWLMAKDVEESLKARLAFAGAVGEIGKQLKQDDWGAIVAIRDYAQYRLAQLQDQRIAATQAEIDRLSDQLASNHAKLTGGNQ